jgi:PPOX class probable F420-dependent enzyme
MAALEQFSGQKYLNLETVRRNGVSVRTPVWFVQDGETLFVRTVGTSGKVKRLKANPRVQVMPCGQAGEPLGSWTPGQARELTDEATFQHVRRLLVEKYGSPLVEMFEARNEASGLKYTVIKIDVEQ